MTGAPDTRQEEDAVGRLWRPDCVLTVQEARRARRLRRQGYTSIQVAAILKAPRRDVELALSPMRGKRPAGTNHATLNVRADTAAMVRREAEPGEPIWQVLDRLLGELQARRQGGVAPG